MSDTMKIKYNKQGSIKEAAITRSNSVGSTSATYTYDKRGAPHLQKAEQKRK